ncbi:efflux RND transporter periplasmic adaptor subunit [Parasulfuritortus cantonensis]|uniref:Efflux RND transporter periplasmic adaptor subunit n=1 Tax=Parasulfuritortus cantonensis TaxID=2528202 RepID=A0A4R1BR07_9PROT|nr:efflux RND transporter periplasmic adaptor subunit [Parasulfuritortus cantonensis]TCJ20140.1 efflux RND transporter periplasmic adaptor subunit [Parasulfuritortus cantonensis]
MNRNFLTAVTLAALLLGGPTACSKPKTGATASAESQASALTVEAATPQTQDWPQTVQASGPLAAWQEVIVAPETGGLALVELKVDVGAKVKRGQLLARLSDQSLLVDQNKQVAAVALARANLEQAQSNLKRARQAEDSGALSAQKIEEYRIGVETSQASLDSAQADLDSTRLKLVQTRVLAADDGVVSSKSGVLGNVVSAGAELFRLVRQDRVEWRPELDAHQLTGLRPGRPARITLPTGQTERGEVRLVGPTLSTSTGRATLYVSLPVGGPGRPGMFAEGSIELDEKPALTLPSSAVVQRDGRAYVYLINNDSTVNSRPVVTGRHRGDRVEIVSGIDAQTRIVASGGAFLSEGVHVAVADAKTAAGAANGTK